jgi:polysaccharide export outer membrane protein
MLNGCYSSDNSPKVLYKQVKASKKIDPIVDHSLMVIDKENKQKLIKSLDEEYRVKIGDSLIISVYQEPDLSTSVVAEAARKTLVDKDGTIQLPKLGTLHVTGMTVHELRDEIVKRLKDILLHPDVTVTVVDSEMSRYYLVGEFTQTKSIEKDYPLTLLEVIAEGGGIKVATADLRRSYVVRNGKKLPINLYRLIEKGDISQNIDMKHRDTVVIPTNLEQFVYVFGRVSGSGKSQIPLINGKLTLTEALSLSRFTATEEKDGTIEKVYVVRTEMDRIETFELNAEKMFLGESIPFQLVAGDVIYIPKSTIGTINGVIDKIFPSLQLIQETLNDINMYRVIIDPSFL